MINCLQEYLSRHGYQTIYLDMMPSAEKEPIAIGLLEWNNPRSPIAGETTHYIQIQVRRTTYDDAKAVCGDILRLLDSGCDERLIPLTDTVSCIGQIRRGPLLLERTAACATFYGELAAWKNET